MMALPLGPLQFYFTINANPMLNVLQGGSIVGRVVRMDKPVAVFIDRDGTIGGTGHFVHPRDFTPYPFSIEALNLLKESGIKIFAQTHL